MTQKEISRLRVINQTIDKVITIKDRRTIIEGSAFSYKVKYYQLIKNGEMAAASCFKGQNKPQLKSKARPASNHPWRQAPNKKPTLSYEETDTEIINMLNDLFGSTRAWA